LSGALTVASKARHQTQSNHASTRPLERGVAHYLSPDVLVHRTLRPLRREPRDRLPTSHRLAI